MDSNAFEYLITSIVPGPEGALRASYTQKMKNI